MASTGYNGVFTSFCMFEDVCVCVCSCVREVDMLSCVRVQLPPLAQMHSPAACHSAFFLL